MSAVGECDAAVTARTKRVWIKYGEYCELLYGQKFLLQWLRDCSKEP